MVVKDLTFSQIKQLKTVLHLWTDIASKDLLVLFFFFFYFVDKNFKRGHSVTITDVS